MAQCWRILCNRIRGVLEFLKAILQPRFMLCGFLFFEVIITLGLTLEAHISHRKMQACGSNCCEPNFNECEGQFP